MATNGSPTARNRLPLCPQQATFEHRHKRKAPARSPGQVAEELRRWAVRPSAPAGIGDARLTGAVSTGRAPVLRLRAPPIPSLPQAATGCTPVNGWRAPIQSRRCGCAVLISAFAAAKRKASVEPPWANLNKSRFARGRSSVFRDTTLAATQYLKVFLASSVCIVAVMFRPPCLALSHTLALLPTRAGSVGSVAG